MTRATISTHKVITVNASAQAECDRIVITNEDDETILTQRVGIGPVEHSFDTPGVYTMRYYGWNGVEVAAPHVITVSEPEPEPGVAEAEPKKRRSKKDK